LLGLVVTLLYLLSVVYGIALNGDIQLHPLWLAVTGIFIVERVVTVRARGPLQMAVASALLIEMPFDMFLQIVHGRAIWDALTNRERRW
jgi:hypothetical protein